MAAAGGGGGQRDAAVGRWGAETPGAPTAVVRDSVLWFAFLIAGLGLSTTVIPCSPLEDDRRFGRKYCHHLQGWTLSQTATRHSHRRERFSCLFRIGLCLGSLTSVRGGGGWDWVHLLRRPAIGILYQPRTMGGYEEFSEMRTDKWNRSIRKKPAPVSLCTPNIPYVLIWDRTQAAAVGSRRLTAWTIARPKERIWYIPPKRRSVLSDNTASYPRRQNRKLI
jgi:hypothetical protein